VTGDDGAGRPQDSLGIRCFGARHVAAAQCELRSNELAKMKWQLWLSQTPYHDPADQPLPDWADTWMREYDRGTDMTKFFGSFGPSGTAER